MRIPRLAAIVAALLAVGAAFVLAAMALGGPSPGDTMVNPNDVSLSALAKVPAPHWQALAGKRIWFAHRSVGQDVLAGLADVQRELPAIQLRVVAGGPEALQGRPGLAEAMIGSNGDPAGKIRDFGAALRAAGPGCVDVALLKLCYVDVLAGTDLEALFSNYREAVATLRAELPGATIVHCTVPLTALGASWKARLKRFLGRSREEADNRAREAWNQRLRDEYRTGPLFDLARAEATLPDGTQTTFALDGARCRCLAQAYTTDGGHLGPAGRRAAARELLRVLVELAAR
ncbi:MAG: SGNH/GDSL hydrolase family protein [Planctomycetes bacterium]|nr:SGNH/GDSL hydrolase family protein [Planctomycetota bacterium]